MKKKKLQKSALSFTLLFSLGISSFPLTTTIHADTQGAQTAEKKQVSLTERTSLFFDYLQQGKYAEALQLTSAAFQSKFTANILQNWWTQSGGSRITSMGTPVIKERNLVHQTVEILGAIEGTTIPLLLKFTPGGKVDEVGVRTMQQKSYTIPHPIYDQPNSYQEREIVIGNTTYPLPATLTVPKHKPGEKVPVVVLVHGSGPQDRDSTIMGAKIFRDLAAGLSSNGIAVLRYEKRSLEHGFKMSAEPATLDQDTTDDAIYAAKSAAQQEGIDPGNIFILGHSQGAGTMPRILSKATSSLVRGSILMAPPARPFTDMLLDQYQYLGAPKDFIDELKKQFAYIKDPTFDPNHPPAGYNYPSPHFMYDVTRWRPVEEVKSRKEPLLILQGARDYQVTVKDDFTRWQEGLSSRSNVQFKEYPKLNHIFTEGDGEFSHPSEYEVPSNVPAYVIQDIVTWVNETKK
ncbi:alpha/beta hydrolase family protein [Bacillus thuringiensis]|uniref:alpha/beta hydrolase family protein n=1 Tax=Bacillus thuringiensis TaxID=1428 RepID=UPI001298E72C|nr:alpha/beta fold hydrolase [Bacillus thuringiensis]MEB8931857.1 alpha/beta fold hydrolase [Bacillus cereus]MCR6790177.1 alpha/beta fold hydrolase [Bacillus thuringiensis]MCR6820652.1 alpha/beta fold hydrolase [Bacillus thuringiensis]MCR6831953.1 alpha/beta fold hydrolase [Bacillus thuringiensis]MEB9914584.1 alpha/beta fold hydrolase [Bacillus cereus]